MHEARGYRPIGDYAVIGDCQGSALVASDGGIDWACLERFDRDPILCRLLDAGRGGHFDIRPVGPHTASRDYLEGTNVVRTVFRTASAEVAITDFMPLGRRADAGPNDYVRVRSPGCLVRRIECLRGEVELEVACRPSVEFACRAAMLRPRADGFDIEPGAHRIVADFPLEAEGDLARARPRLRARERRFAALVPKEMSLSPEDVQRLLRVTVAYWREWIGYCRYAGPYARQVRRSALVLKLMTYPPTGAGVAAPTTSLPEIPRGERNWDYRFCWIRDASLMLHALCGIGYAGEAGGFFGFLCQRLAAGVEKLQVLYGVGGEAQLAERTLEHLEGYDGARPVRAGNGAFFQNQIDLYGYVLEGALVYRELGGRISAEDRRALAAVADFIEGCWERPDTGLWEVRGEPRHYVHSKAMCWVVLDRAIRLLGARPHWERLRERIRDAILREGRDPDGGHLVQAFGQPGTDAALLQLPALGFPLDEETLRRTRRAVERELGRGGFLMRYRTADGLPGRDGAFLVCSFWLVDALLAEGEVDAATQLFEKLLDVANDVGLYPEEIDPATGAFLGNFPQAFTHLGLINTAVSLELVRRQGPKALRGGYASRARRSVGASVGWRGVLAAFLSTGRLRLRSSRASRLAG